MVSCAGYRESGKWLGILLLILIKVKCLTATPSVIAFSLLDVNEESVAIASTKKGVIEAQPSKVFRVQVIGSDLDKNLLVSFAKVRAVNGTRCEDLRITPVQKFSEVLNGGKVAILTLKFNVKSETNFFICLKVSTVIDVGGNKTKRAIWVHQGSEDWRRIKVLAESFSIPTWLKVCLIVILMALSGLFSGLNLGLMSLDPSDLKVVMNSGTSNERKYSSIILPVRKHGNFLLCTLLLGNTLVNSSFTILLDSLTSGIVAVVGSTAAIVIFGEIVPQSICSRYGLAVGACTIWLTKMFMLLTFPLSFPISKILDLILGKEIGAVYNRQQLLEMLRIQSEYNDLEDDEVGIISGALKYKGKTVAEVMTPISDCYLLDEDALLDFKTMSGIIKSGYSRIPVYSGERSNIVALLFVKDLAFVDPDDCIPLLSIIKFYNHPVQKVFYDTNLDKMLEDFKKGTTHLAVVIKVEDEGEGDPVYQAVGIVTLEDIIEEIIQSEIVDETDVYVDNVSGKKVPGRKQINQDLSKLLTQPEISKKALSPQLSFALLQYLSTAVTAFQEELVSRTKLKKIIEYPGIVEEQSIDPNNKKDIFLYNFDTPADYFILIIQGRVEITIGKEQLVFADSSFANFGAQALLCDSGVTFTPDYQVRVLTDTVQYMKVKRSLYRSAVRATQMEKAKRSPSHYEEFDEIFFNNVKEGEKKRTSENNSPNRSTPTLPEVKIHKDGYAKLEANP